MTAKVAVEIYCQVSRTCASKNSDRHTQIEVPRREVKEVYPQ